MQKLALAWMFFTIFNFVISEDGKYTTEYDNIDVDEIINNPRILKNYMNCVLSNEKCTPEGKELQNNIPEALQSDCSKCSEKQKISTNIILKYIIDNEEKYWKLLQDKFDPDRKYTKNYLSSKAQEV